MPEMSSYEEQRLENIRRNEALLRELDLLNGASSLGIDPKTTRRARASAASEAAAAAKPSAAARKARLTPAEAAAQKEAAARRRLERKEATAAAVLAGPTRIQPPRRSSARLAGHEADSEVLKRKYEEEAERAREEREREKRARHEDMDLRRLTGGGLSEDEVRALRTTLLGVGDTDGDATMRQTGGSVRSAGVSRDAEGRSGAPKKAALELEELRAELDKMALGAVNKVTQRRIYSLAFHPTTEKDLIFAGDKEGGIGVWEPGVASDNTTGGDDDDDDDAVDSSMASGKAWTLQVHGKDAVTCLKFDPVDAHSLFSSSYDSTVRMLSLHDSGGGGGGGGGAGTSTEVWASNNSDVLLSVFDVLAPQTHAAAFTATPAPGLEERSLWIADHRGGLIHVDLRERPRVGGSASAASSGSGSGSGRGARAGHQGSSSGPTSRRWQVTEKKIGGMSVNAVYPYAIATAGLDQHVRLFDVRALASLPETPEAPYNASAVDSEALGELLGTAQRASCRARLACTSVDWSPRGDQLAALSYDDVVKIWDVDGSHLRSAYDVEVPARTESAGRGGRSGGRRSVKKEEEDGENSVLRYFKKEPEADEAGASSPSSKAKSSPKKGARKGGAAGGDNVLATPAATFVHNNQTGKWLTMFRAKWNGNAEAAPHFSVGSMHRHAEIWAGDGQLLRSLYEEAWVTAVPAVTAMHPRRVGRLVAGNASGRCYLWSPVEA